MLLVVVAHIVTLAIRPIFWPHLLLVRLVLAIVLIAQMIMNVVPVKAIIIY